MPITTRGLAGNSTISRTNDYGQTVGPARAVNSWGNPVSMGSTRDAGRSAGIGNNHGSTSTGSARTGSSGSRSSSSSGGSGQGGGTTTPTPPAVVSTFNPLTGSWTGNPPAPQRPPLVLPQYPGIGGNYNAWLASLQALPVGPMAPTNGPMFEQMMGSDGVVLAGPAIPERPTIPPNTPPPQGPISEVISKPSTPAGPGTMQRPGFPDGWGNWSRFSRFRTRRANRPYGA